MLDSAPHNPIHPKTGPIPLPAQRILVMRYRFIGDTLLTVPFLRALRAAYPHARIDLLAAPNSGELLRDCPYIDELILFDTTRKHRYENPDSPTPKRSFWTYVHELRHRRYDTAFVLKRSFSSAALALLAGIPRRIGFDTECRGWMLTHRVPYQRDCHEIDSFFSVLQAVGVDNPTTPTAHRLESYPNEQEQATANQVFSACSPRGRHILLHLTSSNPAKEWPPEHADVLVRQLLTDPALHLHSLGAASDRRYYEAIRQALPPEWADRWHVHCGQFTLNESMAFLRHLQLAVGVDSGTMHMAAAAELPVIALFGPMSEQQWAPPGAITLSADVPCRPCHLDAPCRFAFQCMTALSPETVMKQIQAHATTRLP